MTDDMLQNKTLGSIRLFLLDLDGTIYLSETWIDGALDFLRRVEESGRRYLFLTNNSSKSVRAYLDKFERMGLKVSAEQVVTSGEATVDYLKRFYPGQKVFLLGNEILAKEFADAGILLEDEKPDLVVTAFDTSLTYGKLCKVCDFVRAGLPYIATHPDYNCPTQTGFVPDIGSFHALIHASAFRYPDVIIGKPYSGIIRYALGRAGAEAAETAMVGDRLYTDIAAGRNNGLTSILVLSGETALSDLSGSEIRPDLVFGSVKEIVPLL